MTSPFFLIDNPNYKSLPEIKKKAVVNFICASFLLSPKGFDYEFKPSDLKLERDYKTCVKKFCSKYLKSTIKEEDQKSLDILNKIDLFLLSLYVGEVKEYLKLARKTFLSNAFKYTSLSSIDYSSNDDEKKVINFLYLIALLDKFQELGVLKTKRPVIFSLFKTEREVINDYIDYINDLIKEIYDNTSELFDKLKCEDFIAEWDETLDSKPISENKIDRTLRSRY